MTIKRKRKTKNKRKSSRNLKAKVKKVLKGGKTIGKRAYKEYKQLTPEQKEAVNTIIIKTAKALTKKA